MPVIGKKTLKAVIHELEERIGTTSLVEDLRRALKPRRSVVAARSPRRAKQEKKRVETREIRASAVVRADGVCECGCGLPFTDYDPGELDHWFGRGKVPQSIANTWLLRRSCHRLKTLNSPSSDHWGRKFIRHCWRYGYLDAAARANGRLASLEALPRGVR